ncbi:MAG: hypothetical protein M3463_02245 [Verrucomicrobiota bacterium]|nr:hypothetical protein [Verrucomicrobiota bacterium]
MLPDLVRNMVASLFLSALTLVLAACGQRITNQNLEAVETQRSAMERAGKGLSPKEVESILGQPARVESFKIPLETQRPLLEGLRYTYVQDGEEITLHFVDNKLISEVPRLGVKPAVPPVK